MAIHPPFVVKVCGVTTYEDAQAALDEGANALGLNFYPKSSRFLTNEGAAEIISRLRGDYLRVGVFVNPLPAVLARAACFLDVTQIHGEGESLLPIWRAVNPTHIPEPDPSVQAWLLDTVSPGFGGSGQTFDWSLGASFPYPTIVAGGLDAENVAEAIRIANPWGVDSCSRLESSPGKKDHARVAAFVARAFEAFHARQAVNI